jgi:hypothetical protein
LRRFCAKSFSGSGSRSADFTPPKSRCSASRRFGDCTSTAIKSARAREVGAANLRGVRRCNRSRPRRRGYAVWHRHARWGPADIMGIIKREAIVTKLRYFDSGSPGRRRFLRVLASGATLALAGCFPNRSGARDKTGSGPTSAEKEVSPGEDLMREHGVLRRVREHGERNFGLYDLRQFTPKE